jgi:flagellar basal-body rod protein FlgC
MSLDRAVAIGATGLTAQRIRMETITTNLTNAQSTRNERGEAYRRVRPIFLAQPVDVVHAADGGRTLHGVRVASIEEDPSPFDLRFEPGHPDANAEGYVAYPNVDPVREMIDMLSATRSYEAQVTLIRSIRDMLQSALQILA